MHPSRAMALLLAIACVAACHSQLNEEIPDIRDVKPDLFIPPLAGGDPAPGKRVRQTLPEYAGTDVYHVLYLPTDWQPGRTYPVIVEFTGNGGYRNDYGDTCSGRVEDSKLGFGISEGKGYLWLSLPYLNDAGTANVAKWWGDSPSYRPENTVDYCKAAVPWVCRNYGGDPGKVILTGFSRGSIACNYIGLHDDEISRLWRGFVPYSVYDGANENFPYPNADRASALARLDRLRGRPQFICDEISKPGSITSMTQTQTWLAPVAYKGRFTFASTGFRNHNDAWVLRPSQARQQLRAWIQGIVNS